MAEQIVLQGLCNQVKGAIVENGHGMLTNMNYFSQNLKIYGFSQAIYLILS